MTHAQPTVEELYRGMGRMLVRFYGRTPGACTVDAPFAVLACSGLDSVLLNCGVVFGDGPGRGDGAEVRLREFVARIRELGVGGYVCLSERIQRRLEPLARELGLEPLPPIPLMARAADTAAPGSAAHAAGSSGGGEARAPGSRPALDPAAFAVERVVTADGLDEFLAVSEAAFGLPADLYGQVVTPDLLADSAIGVYLCRLEGAPVSGVCVVADEGLVVVAGMATLPDLQGRGIGGLLLGRVLELYRPQARAFYLTASEAGRPLYRRHGFTAVDTATNWVVPPPGA
ncbi:MAG TPA: GNAT family N-acetyltransferase [Thermoleophilia bacterium]|nr:GNAT family N-acetyltransferase [Thermoleophilia bacterium]